MERKREKKKKNAQHDHDHDHSNCENDHHDGHDHHDQPQQQVQNNHMCGCGYADPEQLKKISEQRNKEPQLSLEEKNVKKMAAVEAAKEDGNIQFKEGNYQLSLQIYERGVLIVNGAYGMNDEDTTKMSRLEKELDLNMALCRIKMKQYPEAIENCKMVLNLDKTNVKALYRKGLAYRLMGEYVSAEKDYNAALELDPNNAEVRKQLKELEVLKIEENEKVKKFNQAMVQKLKQDKEVLS